MFLAWSFAASAEPVAYCEAPKALYAWNCATDRVRDGESTWWHLLHDTNGCGQRLVDFAVAHRFARVYLYVGAVEWDWESSFSAGVLPDEDAVADLTTRLRAAGVEPWALWYLNDATDDFGGLERVTDLVESVAAFGVRHPDGAFGGLHGDQEPNDGDSYPLYLEMNTLGIGAADAVNLGWGASLKPAWLTVSYEGAPFFQAALEQMTVGTLMDYSDDVEKVTDQAEILLTHADGVDQRAEIALETGSTDPTPGVSFAELVQTDPDAFLALVGQLDLGFAAHPSYEGIVIHDYTQYFAGLNGGVEPYDFLGPVPALCAAPVPPAETADTGAVETADTGGAEPTSDPEVEEPSGCGCGSASIGSWWALAMILAVRRKGET